MPFEAFMSSVEGPQHRKSGIPNQDCLHFYEEDTLFIAAVADGAGSLRKSGEGAFIAAEAAVEAIRGNHRHLQLIKLVEYGIEAARDKILGLKDYKAYGSTLTLALLRPNGEWATGALGDSFAVIHGEDGSHELATGTPHGEYANQTELLTSDEIHPLFKNGEGALGFSLSSDGLESVAIQDNQAHPGFWNGIRDKARDSKLDTYKLFQWLASLDKLVDDTSLLTVVRTK